MPYSETNVNKLIVNILTKAQYNSIENPNESELYFVTDDADLLAGSGLILSESSEGYSIIGHSNSIIAQATQGLYPITLDAQGHITSYGNGIILGSDTTKFLRNDGTWQVVESGSNVIEGTGISLSESSEGDVISLDSTYAVSANDISTGTDTDPKLVSAKTLSDSFSEVTIIRRWS